MSFQLKMATTQNTDVLQIHDPYTGEKLSEIPWAKPSEIERAVSRANAAFSAWKRSASYDRSLLLKCMADLLREESTKNEIIKLISQEAGKPLAFAGVEVERATSVLEWSSAEALRFSGESLRLDTTKLGREGYGIVQRFPRGIILGITPFNFPLNLLIHKVAPALASGNAILIKPSPFTPLTAIKMELLFQQALNKAIGIGLSDSLKLALGSASTTPAEILGGLFQVVIASDEQTKHLTADSNVAMVSFTGSAKVGWGIRAQAHLKPVTLELGGNAWVVVGPDIKLQDLEAICKRIAGASYGYAGQSCISVQNIAVARNLWEPFLTSYSAVTEGFAYGDPRLSGVSCGPVINATAKNRLEAALKAFAGKQIQSKTLREDRAGGKNLVAPTFLIEPDKMSPLVQQEIFGPVCNGFAFDEPSDVISWINSGNYGLQSGVFTNDLSWAQNLYANLDVGGLIVNDVPTTRFDHQPYGGVKESGFGREGMKPAMEEMTEPRFLSLSPLKFLFALFILSFQLTAISSSYAADESITKASTASLESRLTAHPQDVTKVIKELTALDDSWHMVSEKEGVLTHSRDVDGSSLVEFRGETIMDASVAKILSIFTDTARKREWVDRLEEARDINVASAFSRVEYNHTGAPWPAKDRDFVFSANAFPDPSDKSVLILLKSVTDAAAPENDCCVRANIVQGFYYLKSVNPEQTRVVVRVNADPKGSVPKWIVNMIQKSWPRKTLLSLEAQAQKPDVLEKPSYTALFEKTMANPSADVASSTTTTSGVAKGRSQKVEPKTKL